MINLIFGDAQELLGQVAADSIDVIVTSPPYNLGKDYGVGNDSRDRDDYLTWSVEWGVRAFNALKPEGSLFLNMGGKPSDPSLPLDVAAKFRWAGWKLQNVIHWIKSVAVNDTTYGHYKPINSPRFLNDTHEYIFHFTPSGAVPLNRTAIGVPYQDPSNLSRWEKAANNGLHCRGNCWFIPYRTRQQKSLHPAEFPVELPLWAIRLHQGDAAPSLVVCDPFCGTGATALAAANCGCSFVGFDLNATYLQEAQRRLEEAGHQDVRLRDWSAYAVA